MEDPVQVTLALIERINRHDVEGICGLVTEDHTFIDALGKRVSGHEAVRKAWTEYLRTFPDYAIEVREVFQDGDRLVLLGFASGTVRGAPWKIPAAWKAVVLGDRVWEWRAYADHEPVRKLMGGSI